MKKTIKYTLIIVITMFIILSFGFNNLKVDAITPTIEELQEEFSKYGEELQGKDIDSITKDDILEIYDDVTSKYSNEEIADIISENKDEIATQGGVSKSLINTGAEFIRNTDEKEIRNIIEEDLDIEEVKEKIKNGETPDKIVSSMVSKSSTQDKISLVIKILLANVYIKMFIWIALVLFLYCTILRAVIYKKAGKNPIAAFIPFYRQFTMYRVCKLTPFLMILWLVPVFGWIAMFVIAIVKRFKLSEVFGRGLPFALGLIILPPIFQSVIAFSSNIEYEGEEY